MSKKSSSINLLYLIGMIAVIVGCFLPLFGYKLFDLKGTSAWDRIVSDGSGAVRIGSILAFAGAAAGIVFTFIKFSQAKLVRLICWLTSVAGIVWVIIDYLNKSEFSKTLAKAFNKVAGTKPGLGLIIISAGWIIALIGWLINKD